MLHPAFGVHALAFAVSRRGTRERHPYPYQSSANLRCEVDVSALEPRHEQFLLEEQFLGQRGVEADEEFFLRDEFLLPVLGLDGLHAVKLSRAKAGQAGQIEVLRVRHPAELTFTRAHAAVATVDDPFEHAHVVTKAGPDEITLIVLAEPVHV